MVTINESQDALAFLVGQLNGTVSDTNGNVPVVVTYPHDIESLPSCIIVPGDARIEPISIPAERYRWFHPFDIEVWETSISLRYSLEKSVRDRILALTIPPATQLATNYVFMWITGDSPADIINDYGTPIYHKILHLELIYDLVNPPV